MAIVLKIPCSGEEHTMTWDGERLRFDPDKHSLDLERTFVDLGAELPTCLELYDGIAGYDDHDLFGYLMKLGLLSEFDLPRIALDFAEHTSIVLDDHGMLIKGMTPREFIRLVRDSLDVQEFYLGDALRNKLQRQLNRVATANVADHDIEDLPADIRAVGQALRAIGAAVAATQATGRTGRIAGVVNAADSAREALAWDVTDPESEERSIAESMWQLEHTLKVIEAKQQGKPWPTLGGQHEDHGRVRR